MARGGDCAGGDVAAVVRVGGTGSVRGSKSDI